MCEIKYILSAVSVAVDRICCITSYIAVCNGIRRVCPCMEFPQLFRRRMYIVVVQCR